jgi:D-sedoheptulose 7-phosphate isomerase
MKKAIENIFKESIQVKQDTLAENKDKMIAVVKAMASALKKNRKVVLFGNGGSAADSQHIAAELIGRFQKERRALAAIALTTDTSILTALSNDYSADIVFSRQIEGLGQKGDIAFGLSTSGNSKNVIEGIKAAKRIGMKTVSLTGCGGGKLAKLTDLSLIVPSKVTARIQESHICIAHAVCQLVEDQF